MEWLLSSGLQQLIIPDSFPAWFFIRYWDSEGLHLRLRLKCTSAEDLLAREFHLAQPLQELVRHLSDTDDSSNYSPLIPALSHHTHPSPRIGIPAVKRTPYEPETQIYGEQGIHIAESVFWLSSQVSLGVLEAEAEGLLSRKLLAPLFMNVVREIFAPLESTCAFWERYSRYWMPVTSAWTKIFQRKALIMSEGDKISLRGHSLTDPHSLRLLRRWRIGLDAARKSFVDCENGPHWGTGLLAFHITHLMNNRLGISPVEESYLAALLAVAFNREEMP